MKDNVSFFSIVAFVFIAIIVGLVMYLQSPTVPVSYEKYSPSCASGKCPTSSFEVR